MPSSPIRMAWSFSSRRGSSCRIDRLLGVDFRQAVGDVSILHAADDRFGPGQPRLVGHAAAEDERGLGHRQRNPVVIGDRPIGLLGEPGDGVGIGVEARVLLGLAVVHPHLVAAGALRHDPDERRIDRLRRRSASPARRRTGRSNRPRPARRRSSASSNWPARRWAGRCRDWTESTVNAGSTGPAGAIASGFW